MTDSNALPDDRSTPQPDRLSLSLTQVLASVLAAVSASVAASTFGVAGTVIGAALGSAVTVIGSAVYAQSLKRSREAVRLTLGVAAAKRLGTRPPQGRISPAPVPSDPDRAGRPGRRHRLRLALTPQRLALGAGALFVVTLALITGFELLTGQPVAASVDGKHGSGVSLLGGVERSRASTRPAPASTAATSTAPAQSRSGTSAPTPTVTVTITPSASPSATPSATAPTGSDSTAPSPAGSTAGASSGAGTPGGG